MVVDDPVPAADLELLALAGYCRDKANSSVGGAGSRPNTNPHPTPSSIPGTRCADGVRNA